jgi:hypothetical protein
LHAPILTLPGRIVTAKCAECAKIILSAQFAGSVLTVETRWRFCAQRFIGFPL